MKQLVPFTLVNQAISGAATTPVPAGAGSMVWSTATNSILVWNGTSWYDTAAVSASAIVDIFLANGTWNKPAGAIFCTAMLRAAGGGGGSGRKGAASSARSGGAGGGAGGYSEETFDASTLPSTVSITVGTGGPGGAAQATNSTNGNSGTAGGNTSFGPYLKAVGGGAGAGGGTAAATGGSAGGGTKQLGAAGASTPATPGAGVAGAVANWASSGGGSGGGIPTGNTASAGGAGGAAPAYMNQTLAAGSAGASAGGAGGNGTADPVSYIGSGGGGGGSSITATNAGNGGNGANYGAGGGGGGAALDSTNNSGAGGSGAPGIAIVRTVRGTLPGQNPQVVAIACSDEVTALTAGTAKVTFILPFANGFRLGGVSASLTTAQTSGSTLTVDVKQAGVSIFSTLVTLDNTKKNSSLSAVQPVIYNNTLGSFAEVTIDITQIGDGTAKGLKVYLLGYPL